MARPWEREWTVVGDAPATSTTTGPRPWEQEWTVEAEDAPAASSLARGAQVGVQGLGRGLAEFAGAPVDIVSLIMNTGAGLGETGAEWAADALGFEDVDLNLPRVSRPVGGSEWLRDQATGAAEAVGVDPIDELTLSPAERLSYNVNRFGVQGLTGGAAGLAHATRRLGQQAAGGAGSRAPQLGDAFAAPYTGQSPGRVVTADTAAGAGAGAGVTGAQEVAPDNLALEIGGALGGGVAGGLLTSAPRIPGALADAYRRRFTSDPDIPYAPGSLEGTTPRIADLAARVVQDASSDPSAAARNIARRQARAESFGEPMPSAGIASDDTGLIGLELGARQGENPAAPNLRRDFIESDTALRRRAARNVEDVQDPGADLPGGLSYAQGRPGQLREIRDAEAIPLLRQAEESGALVDAAPVARLIDGMLGETKRPPVRSALTQARSMLNAVGSDNLDTSVSGLYETRKAINDIIQGRSDDATGRFAQRELIEVRNALDEAITDAVPEFGQYLDIYRQGSRALDIFERSQSVSRLMGEERDLRNVARRILSSGDFGSDQLIRDVNTVVAESPEAARAWRAAVADVLAQRVQTTQTDTVSLAALDRTFRTHRGALAEVFPAEDLATLERAHEMLRPLQNLGQGVRAGSHTQDNRNLIGLLDAAILASTGNAITTGMIMTRIRRAAGFMASQLGFEERTTPYKVNALLSRMWFDPDLARHLLERPIEEGAGAMWNHGLQRLIAGSHFARDQVEGEDEPVLLPTIRVTPEDELTDAIMR